MLLPPNRLYVMLTFLTHIHFMVLYFSHIFIFLYPYLNRCFHFRTVIPVVALYIIDAIYVYTSA